MRDQFLWDLLAGLLLLAPSASAAFAQAQRPVRVMQESPWIINPLSGAIHPVQAYWDQRAEIFFIDLTDLFAAIAIPVEIEGSMVRAVHASGVYEVDFASGAARHVVNTRVTHSDTLAVGGFFRDGDTFLLTPPNVQKVFPPGVLTYDASTLTIRFSTAFAQAGPSFRSRPTPHTLGPLLYGRTRKLLGATQVSYRMNRTQRQERSADYTGSLQVLASALGGRISADGSLSYTNSGQTATGLRQINYLLDFPESPYLTQIVLGRTHMYRWPVRQAFEGLRLSNLPLSTRHQQREAEINGVAEPNALVSASVNGVIADRVQADGQGRYVLRVPTYYGASRAEVEITPASGGAPTTETRYLFVSDELTPPRILYWDLQAGRNRVGHTPFGYAQASLGLTRHLTARSSFALVDTRHTATLGLISNIGGFVMTSAEVAYPARAVRATLQLFHDNLQIQGEAALAEGPGFTLYRQRFLARLGWSLPRFSVFLNGNRSRLFGGSTSSSLHGSGTIRLSRKTNLMLAAGPTVTKVASEAPADARFPWRMALTRYVSIGQIRGRIGFQGEGGRYETMDFGGGTMYATYRSISFGARIGYDFPTGELTTSLSLRVDTPWAGFSGHSSLAPENPYHVQSLYGSMTLGHGLTFSRHPQVWSSAVLQPYVDLNRDGNRDPGESSLAGLDIHVVRARTEPAPSGSARADFLAPSTQYQVVIDPRSILRPELAFPTGTTFSFVSDPGETKRVDIPVYKNTIIDGMVTGLPLSSPTLAVVVLYQGAEEVARAAISQDGRFTALLAPGVYRLEIADLLGNEDLSAFTRTLNVEPVDMQHLQIQGASD